MRRPREEPLRIIIRRRANGAAPHGGAWKVAFADFMTAMFALFLVLWLVNQSSDVKSAIAGYFQDPLGRADEHGSSILPGEGAQTASVRLLTQEEIMDLRRNRLSNTAERIEKRIQELPEYSSIQGNIEVTLTKDGLRIELTEDSSGVFFKTGRSRPTDQGERVLSLLGAELGMLPFPVKIEGHTDAHPYPGTSRYTNWELSTDRANTARRIMNAHGLGPFQITEIAGYAAREPRDPADPFSPRNRRISITMLIEEPVSSAVTESVAGAPERAR